MKKTQEVPFKLDSRRQYLLQRIPGKYDINGFHTPPDPLEVVKAQKLVDAWRKKVGLLKCQHDKRSEALVRKAREAVYFESEEKALAIIRQVEKLLKGCEE